MLKYLLSVCSIFVLLFPTIFLPSRTVACPVKNPETLLSLYRHSDTIYVARFDKVEDQEIIENTDERTILNIKKHFDISSTLKGEPQKLFVLEDEEYRYKPREGETIVEVETVEDVESYYGVRNLKSGDVVILFLKKGEDGKTLELADYRDAIRKMLPGRLDSYEARIRELNAIFSTKKVDTAAIVEWLVRCPQDPATRWEGAYELQQSFRELKWQEVQEKEEQESEQEPENNEAAASDETVEIRTDDAEQDEAKEEGEDAEEAEDEGEYDNTVYARTLTDAQKQTLMNVVLERRPSPDTGEASMSIGDRVLLDVVSNWGDNRFASFLFDRLQASAEDTNLADDLMTTIARIVGGEELEKIASDYNDVYYQDGDEVVEEEEAEEKETAEAPETAPAVAISDGAATAKREDAANPEQPVKKVTYKELRERLFTDFLNKAFVAIQIANAQKPDPESP